MLATGAPWILNHACWDATGRACAEPGADCLAGCVAGSALDAWCCRNRHPLTATATVVVFNDMPFSSETHLI